MDLETLDKLGLRDIPRWYREKYNVKSLVSSGGSSRDRTWRSGSREASGPQTAAGPQANRYEPTAPRLVPACGLESASQYASGSPSAGNQVKFHQSLALSQPAKDPYDPAERAHFWRRLDLLGDEHPSGPPSLPLQTVPATTAIGTERAVNHEAGPDGNRQTKTLTTSMWAGGPVNKEQHQPNLTMASVNPSVVPPVPSAMEQNHSKRKSHRSRRLYQARNLLEGPENNNDHAAVFEAGRNSAPIPHSVSSPSRGSRPPSRMSEVNHQSYYQPVFSSAPHRPHAPFTYGQAMMAPARRPHLALDADYFVREKKVKQNNDHPYNQNMNLNMNVSLLGGSRPGSANGLGSRVSTPDTDPYGLGLMKFD